MFNRLRPRDCKTDQILEECHFEGPQSYLARERRMLWLRGTIAGAPHRWDQFSPSAVHDSIIAFNWEDPHKPIYLMIDSPGGYVSDGLILYDVIRYSTAPIVTIAQSAASMATVVFAAGHRRLVYPHSRLMMHLPRGDVSGDVKQVELATQEMRRLTDIMADIYIECGVKKSKKELLKDIDREYWLGAEEAIEIGLAHAIITPEELMGRIIRSRER